MNLISLKSTNWLTNGAMWINVAQWLGGIIIVFWLAQTVWTWVDHFIAPKTNITLKTAKQTHKNNNAQTNVSSLIARNIFGAQAVKQAKPVEVTENAPETKLNLKLRGIYAADNIKKANAIIEDGRGKQAVYFIDEKLSVSGRVFLRQVQVDKVILETNGKREALTLITEEMPIVTSKKSNTTNKSKGKKSVNDKRGDQRISKRLNEYRDKFAQDPTSVADAISGRPHIVNGELQGFSISPGKDRKLFEDLGLRRNDVITSINGVALNNMQDAMSLMQDVKSLSEVSVEIQRGQEQLNLLLNLNEKVGR